MTNAGSRGGGRSRTDRGDAGTERVHRARGRFRPDLLALEDRRLPSTFTVTSVADDGSSGTLRWAVLSADSAGGSNTVAFAPTVFGTPQTILLSEGELVLTSGTIAINGPGAGLLTLNGDRFDRLFQVDSGVTASISGLTITDGSAVAGGGLYDQGNATLAYCSISGNTATDGGALYGDGRLTLTGCTIGGNTANYGGALWNRGTATLTACSLVGNSAYMGGGVLNHKYGHVNLTDCTISGNSASLGGGLSNYGQANLTACTVSGNTATNTASNPASNPGGGIYNYSNQYGGKTTLVDTIVAGNAGYGGAASDVGGNNSISVVGTNDLVGMGGSGGMRNGIGGDIVLTSVANLDLAPLGDYGGPTPTMPPLAGSPAIGAGASANEVTTDQRGFALDSPVDIGADQAVSVPLVVAAATDDGAGTPLGGLDLRGAIDLANIQSKTATITFNSTAFATAQTIALTAGTLTLSDMGGPIAIDGPAAGLTLNGGGLARVLQVDAGVTATFSGLTISGGGSTFGGGVYNQGTATLADCTIVGNSAGVDGGGLANTGTLSLVECTVSGNTAGGEGGGLFNSSQAYLTACTVSGNTASGKGGGIYDGAAASGRATLGDTIVASNAGSGGSASDIGGRDAANVVGTYNLVGTGGSGGISNGSGRNIVLTSLAGLGLAPLGNYGGPTSTIALLPGCPAVDAGSNSLIPVGVSIDQRGEPRVVDGTVDIGAFESQGFTLTPAAGSTPQTATTGTSFANPLALTVSANNSVEPVVGGVVTFTVEPSGGAGATLSASSVTVGAGGSAQVTATANSTAGHYTVAAAAAGATAVSFNLTNQQQIAFSGLSDQSIVYGTASVSFSGKIADGAQVPAGEDVGVTLNGITQQATIGSDGSFSTTFNDTAGLGVAGSPYTVGYSYSADGTFPATSATSKLTVTPATPTVTVADAGGTYNGSAFVATATVAGIGGLAGPSLEGVGLTLSYYAGGTASGTPLSGPPIAAGTYTVQASFAGSTDYAAATAQATFVIAQAVPTIAWAAPGPIVYGTALGAAQLDATASVPGTFAYNPASGAVLSAGVHTLSVTFTPTDAVDYATATATTSITVAQATPAIIWNTPAPITYGTALGPGQLNAAASVKGSFSYNPAAGTILGAGSDALTVTFTPTDSTDYTTATATTTITVVQATPAITWSSPAPIAYGTGIGSSQLDATASVPGTFAYNPAAGTILGVGSYTLTVTFMPTDAVDYTTATATTTITVAQATPAITWSAPASIAYGTPLGAAQLDATASVSGTFAYNPAAGTVLAVGSYTLSVTFTPTDAVDYATATATTTITVAQTATAITWSAPAPIVYGMALGSAQLDASADAPGTFAYTPAAGTVLGAGSHTLSVTFTPTDPTEYTTATATTTITVAQAIPAITWAAPGPIVYGTALGLAQLDATANVPGTFAYTPVAGAVLGAGVHTLSVTFTPTDAVDYATATATTSITVEQATPAITWNTPAPITYGTPLGSGQLDAAAGVRGSFSYDPVAGTILGGGAHTLSVSFTPADSTDYTTATATTTIAVEQATSAVTWNTPAPIPFGTGLGASQLDATASVPGTFTYDPAAGAVLGVGSHTLSVTFTPTDDTDYTTATATTTITVGQATPAIIWSAPASIVYGTALGSAQLDTSTAVSGTFAYNPAAGTVLGVGNQTLMVTFTPTDSTDYTTATATTTITVVQATPTITWTSPASIVYGTRLGSIQLDASAGAGGRFSYSPAAGAILGAGVRTLSVTFTPTDSTDYATATATTTITIAQAVPTVGVSGGGVYDGSPIRATATVTGVVPGVDAAPAPSLEGVNPTLTYYAGSTATGTPIAGAPTAAGTYTVVADFPGSADYAAATAQESFAIAQATPSVAWVPTGPIVYGTALGGAQLDATASVPGHFAYDPDAGVVLSAGVHTLSVTFTPTDSTDYTAVTASTSITVTRATPAITWNPPAPITYGTPLGALQLDATASVPGSFTYTPAAGTVLGAGTDALSVTFTPTDTTDDTTATAGTSMIVSKATAVVGVSDAGGVYNGSPFAATATVAGIGGTPKASLEGVEAVLTYYSGSTATGPPLGGPPTAVGTYTVVASFPGSVDYASASSTPVTFDITAPAVTVTLESSAGSTVYGQPVTLTATVSSGSPGVGAGGGAVAFLDGSATLASVPLDASGQAVLTVASLGLGGHSITAVYTGTASSAGVRSGGVSESVTPADTQVVLVPHAVLKRKRVVSLSLTAEIEPLTPGGGIPTGMVSFTIKKKRLGTAALSGGQATLVVKPGSVLNKSITIIYSGSDDFLPTLLATPKLKSRSLAVLPHPLLAEHHSRPAPGRPRRAILHPT
jgi:hypothetical protein